MDYTPIRKLIVGALAALVTVVAHAAGLPLGPAFVNHIAVAVVGFAVAYLVHDPRVLTVKDALDEAYAKGDAAVAKKKKAAAKKK